MPTEQHQGEPLADALARTRAEVADPRFGGMADDAIRTYGDELRGFLGRADVGELFTPLDVWTGRSGSPAPRSSPRTAASSPGVSPAAPAPR